jgi:hypothetical protein
MKRYNLIQARGAESTGGAEGMESEGAGSDLIEINVKTGTLSVIVPASLPDVEVCEECFNHHTCLDLELEDGTRVTGWIRSGEAQLEVEFPGVRSAQPAKTPSAPSAKTELVQHVLLSPRTAGRSN